VNIDLHTVVTPEPLGEPEMVAVAMGEHDAANAVHRSAHARELSVQVVSLTGQTRVDDGHAFIGVDEVGGHDVISDAMPARRATS
jgi:hypothetical protein